MVINILNSRSELDSIIPACIPHADAIKAAEQQVLEAAIHDITLTAVDEDGESVFDEDFETIIKFIPHARRIASNLMDRMSQNPAELHMLLSGAPQVADLISGAITSYFEKQIAISKEYLDMPENKRTKVREQLFTMMFSKTAA
jgi:hypothetical protein